MRTKPGQAKTHQNRVKKVLGRKKRSITVRDLSE